MHPVLTHIRSLAHKLLHLELWIVGLLVGASVVSTRLLLPALVVAGVFWGIRWVAGDAFGTHPLADGAIALLSSMALISLTITTQHETTLIQVYRLFSGIALTYAIVHWVRCPLQKTDLSSPD